MKKLFLLVFASLASPAIGKPLYGKFCFENGRCFQFGSQDIPTIGIMPVMFTDGGPINEEAKLLLNSLGFAVRAPKPSELEEWSSQPAPRTLAMNINVQLKALSDISDLE